MEENTKPLTLSVEEARQKLGKISRGSFYEAIRRGDIPSIRIGRRILIPRAALERLLGITSGPGMAADYSGYE